MAKEKYNPNKSIEKRRGTRSKKQGKARAAKVTSMRGHAPPPAEVLNPNPENLVVVDAVPHLPPGAADAFNNQNPDDNPLQYAEDVVLGQVVPVNVNPDDRVVMAVMHAGSKRNRRKKRSKNKKNINLSKRVNKTNTRRKRRSKKGVLHHN